MLPLADAVQDLPWRMVFLDLPWAEGAAGSSTAASAVEVADEVLSEIDDHLGEEPFAVIGNSFGGMIARHVAHKRRDRVLGIATLAGVVQPAHVAARSSRAGSVGLTSLRAMSEVINSDVR